MYGNIHYPTFWYLKLHCFDERRSDSHLVLVPDSIYKHCTSACQYVVICVAFVFVDILTISYPTISVFALGDGC